jgi:pyrrolidone-carboxylate peptidase
LIVRTQDVELIAEFCSMSVQFCRMAMIAAMGLGCASAYGEFTKTILITGYWPPTNEMIRPWSADIVLNPDGWIGGNWENRGYNVYAYFPTFANPMCTSCGQGMGDFEVDYQDTSADFWPLVATLKPVAIVTFSRTNGSFVWQVEQNALNYLNWTNDYTAPLQPTPTPPDASVPANAVRQSTLPMQAIVNAMNAAGLGINASIDPTNSGAFLSGYMAYHGMWYQSLHAAVNDPARCVAAGHIHVGPNIPWNTATEGTKVTLREVTEYLDSVLGVPGDVNIDGRVDIDDLLNVINSWGPCPLPPMHCPADLDGSDAVNIDDLLYVINSWTP